MTRVTRLRRRIRASGSNQPHRVVGSPWENGLTPNGFARDSGLQSVHLKAGTARRSDVGRVRVDFPGSGPARTAKVPVYMPHDWHDATPVCTPEGYHEHYAGELALLAQQRVGRRALTRVPLGRSAAERIMHGIYARCMRRTASGFSIHGVRSFR